MGTYRVEWPCCGSVTETEGWEPDSCPFCTDDAAPFRKDAALLAWVLAHPETAAEELDDAAAGNGTARGNLERRIAGLALHNAQAERPAHGPQEKT